MKTEIMDMLKRTKGNRIAANVNNDFGTDDDEEFKTGCMPPALETEYPGATGIQNSSSTSLHGRIVHVLSPKLESHCRKRDFQRD